MKILVVDDNASVRDPVKAYIESDGHSVIAVASGEAALEAFRESTIDLVLMDVEMPGIDGFETTRQLRILLEDEWIPIIFLSANTSDSHYERGIDAGGDDYMTKPVSAVTLKAKLKAMERIVKIKTALVRANLELAKLNMIDALTQIANRRGFEIHAGRAWKDCLRQDNPLSVIMLDIDQFKQYNDSYGHQAGDSCLKIIAQTLSQTLTRPYDQVARYGGEEFVAVLPQCGLEDAKHVAENMRQAIEECREPHESSIVGDWVTISAGVCSTNKVETTSIKELLANADKSLYLAKSNGRNTVEGEWLREEKRVLVVDDDAKNLSHIQGILQDKYSVNTALSGYECMAHIDATMPDLILLDLGMSDLDGLALCKMLKQNRKTRFIPIIFMSSQNKKDQFIQIREAGGSGFIAKPVDSEVIVKKVANFLK